MRNILRKAATMALSVAMVLGAAQAAFADRDYRDARFASFKPLPICDEGDIVFVGNSITDMLDWYEATGSHVNVHGRGTSGCYAEEILKHLPAMVTGNPSKVFLMIGTNNLGDNSANTQYPTTAQNVIPIIKETLLAIRRQAPNADVYYQSILPAVTTSAVGVRNREKTEAVNNGILEWIEQQADDKLHYVDLYSSFVAADGSMKNNSGYLTDTSWSNDGLHLTQIGYRVWLQKLQEIGALDSSYAPVFPENATNVWANESSALGMRNTYFGAMPVKSSDILFFGDGNINIGSWHELLGSADFKSRAQNWHHTGNRLSVLTQNHLDQIIKSGNINNGVSRQEPAGIILYAGAGELIGGSSSTSVFSSYTSVVNALRNLFPNTAIFVSTLALAKDSSANSRINSFNNTLRSTYGNSGAGNIHVIDFNSVITLNDYATAEDRQSFGSYSSTELEHMNYFWKGSAYVKMAQAIAEKVNAVLHTNYQAMSTEEMETTLKIYEVLSGIYGGNVNAGNKGKSLSGDQVTYFTNELFPAVAAKLTRSTINEFFDNLDKAYDEARTVEGEVFVPLTEYVSRDARKGKFYSYKFNPNGYELRPAGKYQYYGTFLNRTDSCELVARWVSEDGLVTIDATSSDGLGEANNNLWYFRNSGFIAGGKADATVANPYNYIVSTVDPYLIKEISFDASAATDADQTWVLADRNETYTARVGAPATNISIPDINQRSYTMGLAGSNKGAVMANIQVMLEPKDDVNGIEDVVSDDSNAPIEYYNLQGIRIEQPAPGQIYIARQGSTVKKVVIR